MPPASKVLDAKGRPLSVGARVERVLLSGERGMVGRVTHIDRGVWVDWGHGYQGLQGIRRRFSVRRSYICPVLELIDQYDKEESR